jgi:hypothetical protein
MVVEWARERGLWPRGRAPRTPQIFQEIGPGLEPEWGTVFPGCCCLDHEGEWVVKPRCQLVIPADKPLRETVGLLGLLVEGGVSSGGGVWADRLGSRLALNFTLQEGGGVGRLMGKVRGGVEAHRGSLALLSYSIKDGKVHLGLWGNLCTAYIVRSDGQTLSFQARRLRKGGGVTEGIPVGYGDAVVLLTGRADAIFRDQVGEMKKIVGKARDGETAAEKLLKEAARYTVRVGKGRRELETMSAVVLKMILPKGGVSA